MPGDVVTQAALDRLNGQGTAQTEAASQQLALTPYEYGTAPGGIDPGPHPQAAHPSAQRLGAPNWQGKTGLLNNAQAAQDRADVWVTVPVDKVVSAGGSSKVAPVYASPQGYVPRPGESTGSIPPALPAGRPY